MAKGLEAAAPLHGRSLFRRGMSCSGFAHLDGYMDEQAFLSANKHKTAALHCAVECAIKWAQV